MFLPLTSKVVLPSPVECEIRRIWQIIPQTTSSSSSSSRDDLPVPIMMMTIRPRSQALHPGTLARPRGPRNRRRRQATCVSSSTMRARAPPTSSFQGKNWGNYRLAKICGSSSSLRWYFCPSDVLFWLRGQYEVYCFDGPRRADLTDMMMSAKWDQMGERGEMSLSNLFFKPLSPLSIYLRVFMIFNFNHKFIANVKKSKTIKFHDKLKN